MLGDDQRAVDKVVRSIFVLVHAGARAVDDRERPAHVRERVRGEVRPVHARQAP